MPDLLETGATWLAGQLKAHASRDVTYRRGAQQVVLKATAGRTEAEATDDEGGVLRIESRDFIVQAADLVLGGTRTLPELGDLIELTDSQGVVHRYELMTLGVEGHWRWSDPYHTLLRIHTKEIDPD